MTKNNVFKENRGRPLKYKYPTKVGQVVSLPFSTGARITFHSWAKRNGRKIRTWKNNESICIELMK